jgi:DNA topoisomerase IA
LGEYYFKNKNIKKMIIKNYEKFEDFLIKFIKLKIFIQQIEKTDFEVINIDSKKNTKLRDNLFNGIDIVKLKNEDYNFSAHKASYLK